MSYSARQLHCLEAMGLVAWTSTETPALQSDSVSPAQGIAQSESTVPDVVPVAPSAEALAVVVTSASTPTSPSTSKAAPDTLGSVIAVPGAVSSPTQISELAQWLTVQPLANFNYRGSNVNCVGPEQASLLVVCLDDKPVHGEPVQLPLDSECAQLFELMMRSINMMRNNVRQCAVVSDKTRQAKISGVVQGVETLCTAQTRAILVLDPSVVTENAAQATDVTADNCLMPASSLPLWRVPHPQQLMLVPLLKRRAWEALKNLQNLLAA